MSTWRVWRVFASVISIIAAAWLIAFLIQVAIDSTPHALTLSRWSIAAGVITALFMLASITCGVMSIAERPL